ncbi:MAG: PilZ domain-containing protein [Myxococcota bacterium]
MEYLQESVVERRAARRVPVRRTITIRSAEREWSAFCLDASLSGLGVWSEEPVSPGRVLTAGFRQGEESFEIEAEVVRCEDSKPALLGMRITRVHPRLFALLNVA